MMYDGGGVNAVLATGLPVALPGGHAAVDLPGIGMPADMSQSTTELTLSESLELAHWDLLLPSEKNITKQIKETIRNPVNIFTLILYFITGIAGLFYFPSAIVLNIRGIIFGATTDEKDIETARTLTDSLGYFWVPGVITVATAVTGILQYLNNRKQNRRSFSFLMKDYKDNRRVFINNHNLTGAFFAITEIIQRLRFLANTDPLYYIKLEQIEKDLNKIAQKISHDFKIIFEKNINNLIISSPLNIIEQLQRLLASTKFNYVTNNIKKELILNSIVLKMSHKLRSDYQQKINNDFILHKIIIDIIAELSSVKSRIGTSPYLQSIKLIEESTLGGIRQALIKYWHQPEIKKKIVHSYDVNFSALAMEINNMMREVAPDQILQETRPIRRLPPHLSTVVATPWRPVRVTASVRVLSSPIGGASQPIGSPPGACYIPSPVRPQHSR